MKLKKKLIKPAIVGLGYVGLPLLTKISAKYTSIGFDINEFRLSELRACIDSTGEVTKSELEAMKNTTFTSDIEDLVDCNFYIITVPTPVTSAKIPDFSYLKSASSMVGSVLKPDDIVVYESTVFPGATEEICVPLLEAESKLIFNKTFYGILTRQLMSV